MTKKEQIEAAKHHVDAIVNCIIGFSNNEDDVKRFYEYYLKTEGEYMSLTIKRYFKKRVFGEVSYEETKKKMLELMKHSVSQVTFEGKEFNNIQRFLRELKLNKLK